MSYFNHPAVGSVCLPLENMKIIYSLNFPNDDKNISLQPDKHLKIIINNKILRLQRLSFILSRNKQSDFSLFSDEVSALSDWSTSLTSPTIGHIHHTDRQNGPVIFHTTHTLQISTAVRTLTDINDNTLNIRTK